MRLLRVEAPKPLVLLNSAARQRYDSDASETLIIAQRNTLNRKAGRVLNLDYKVLLSADSTLRFSYFGCFFVFEGMFEFQAHIGKRQKSLGLERFLQKIAQNLMFFVSACFPP